MKEQKKCFMCKEVKERKEFDNDKSRFDNKYPYCKDCRRKLTNSKKRITKVIGKFNNMLVVDDRYPRILTPQGSVRVHRYVMENKLGRKLKPNEVVHHIDGNKKNWEISNLVVVEDSVHRSMETHARLGYKPIFTCNTCGKQRSYSNYVMKVGRLKFDSYQCRVCYYKDGGAMGRNKKNNNSN